MYCPECLGDSLYFSEKGVLQVFINGKQMNTSKMFFNRIEKSRDKFIEELTEKLAEYLDWYSEFENKAPVKNLIICSNDVSCDYGCKIPMAKKTSVIPELIKDAELKEILTKLCDQRGLTLNLQNI